MEHLRRRLIVERLARPRVRLILDLAHLPVRDLPEIRPLRETAAHQTVRMPVQFALPRMAPAGETADRVQRR